MAQFPHLYLLVFLAAFALSCKGASTSQDNHYGFKSLHFELFQHGELNKTAYVIVNGVAGVPNLTVTTAPFGTLYALQDRMTLESNSSSDHQVAAGVVEGTTVTSTFDGLWNLIIYKFTLHLKHHKGTIIIVGGLHSVNPSDIPVVGGTGDFKFAQGYVTTSLVQVTGFTTYTYKIEFHLHWPPYAYPA